MMDRLDLLTRTLEAWQRFDPNPSQDPGLAYATYRELPQYLRLLIDLERRVRSGNRTVSAEESAMLDRWRAGAKGLGPLAGIAMYDVSDVELKSLLHDTEIEAKKLRGDLSLRA